MIKIPYKLFLKSHMKIFRYHIGSESINYKSTMLTFDEY